MDSIPLWDMGWFRFILYYSKRYDEIRNYLSRQRYTGMVNILFQKNGLKRVLFHTEIIIILIYPEKIPGKMLTDITWWIKRNRKGRQ